MTARITITNTDKATETAKANSCEVLVRREGHTVEQKELKPGESHETYVYRGQEIIVRHCTWNEDRSAEWD